MSATHRNTGLEAKLLEILTSRESMAIEMDEFKLAAGLEPKAFWCALARLERKGDVFRWQSEKFKEYFVLTKHRGTAYYMEPARVVRSIFDAQPTEVLVRRSPPFVTLTDENRFGEPEVLRQNRYAETVA